MLGFLIVVCGLFVAPVVFGQATGNASQTNFTWIAAGVGDLATATNWSPNGVPNPSRTGSAADYGDIMAFDGQTVGPVQATSNGGAQTGSSVGGTTAGIYVHLTANQTGPVTFYTTVANSASSGIRFNSIMIDAGAGAFRMGTGSTTNCLDTLWGTSNPSGQGLTNNSANPAVINLDVRWRLGAGGAHTFTFGGTGDWYVTNDIANVNGSASLVAKDGPGTMYWTAGHNSYWGTITTIASPMTITGGKLVLRSGGLFPSTTTINNSAALVYDAPVTSQNGGAQTIVNPVNGTGSLQVNNGTLTLAGASAFSGNINLTGGELIAGGTENVGVSGPFGQGGIISFNGGTLGWSPANAFDYSSRFDASAGQIYNFDTGGASPTLATGLSSSGGTVTKIGGGTLTLAGTNTYTGLTTVSVGQLLFQGTKLGNANITVGDGAVLGVVENDSQIAPGTLTVGTATGATLEFNNVTNHAAATLAPNTLVANGPVTINVNSGRFRSIGETFPLLKWTSGTPPAVTLGFLAGAGGHLVTNVNGVEIDIVIDDPPYIWTDLAADNTWNTTSIDWQYSGANVAWVNGHYSLMDDTAGGTGNVTLSGTIAPTNATINNSSVTYAITSSAGNLIGGAGSLTKNGNGTLTLPGGANTYTGVTTVGGGILAASVLANGGSASDIGAAGSGATNIVLNGGTLQYTGTGVSIDRLFSVGANGGTVDSEGSAALIFNNSGALGMSGNGPRTFTLTGPGAVGDTIASAIVNHPAGTALTKSGLGTWILTGTNTYASGTTVIAGTLQVGGTVGVAGPSGSLGSGKIVIASGATVDFQRTGTLTIAGAISGSGSVVNDGGGTVILANNNSYSGGTTINAGTLQVGNGGGAGSLNPSSLITDNGTLIFNTSGSFSYSGAGYITGTGNVIVRGGGKTTCIGANDYTGWTQIDANSTFQPCQGNSGALASSVVTNNGTLLLIRQDNAVFIYAGPITGSGRVWVDANNFNPGDVTLTASNNYTGGTFIGDNGLIVDDGSGNGWITGNVSFVNSSQVPNDNARTLTFNRPDDFTFAGNIITNFTSPQSNQGTVVKNGAGVLTLTGNNTYASGTTVNAGGVQIGNGGGTGSVGSGPVTLTSGTPLVVNRTGSLAIPGNISGGGGVINLGSATLTLGGSNSYTGATIVSNGTLVAVQGLVGGDLNLEGGTYIAGSTSVLITNTVAGSMNIDGGTLVATLNKSVAQSNTYFQVTGAINRTGGTLKLLTVGSLPSVGEKYVLFSQPVAGGAAMPIVSPGFTVANNLAVDGSVTVTTVQPAPTITATVSGSPSQLTLTWPSAWAGGVHLQNQTNTLTKGISSNWVTIPGTDASNSYTNTINRANGSVFYRLITP